jgi:predicted nucleic acid-binding Zn ribbon protein
MTPAQLRARVIADWRGLPETPFARENERKVSDVIGAVMKELGLEGRLREEEVKRSWQEIVGEFVARHSSPQKMADGVLTVRVLQPTLRFELERVWKRDIVAKLKARFGARTVRDVKFLIG